MFRLLCLAAACAISFTISAPSVQAGESDPETGEHRRHHGDRVKEGATSGELTGKEVSDIAKGQRRIRRMRKRAAEDGEVTDEERRRIRRARKHQSGRIYRKKHNRQKRD